VTIALTEEVLPSAPSHKQSYDEMIEGVLGHLDNAIDLAKADGESATLVAFLVLYKDYFQNTAGLIRQGMVLYRQKQLARDIGTESDDLAGFLAAVSAHRSASQQVWTLFGQATPSDIFYTVESCKKLTGAQKTHCEFKLQTIVALNILANLITKEPEFEATEVSVFGGAAEFCHVDGRLLDARSAQRAEVVGGLEAQIPCVLVDLRKYFARGAAVEDVKDCDWSIQRPRCAAALMSHCGSISNTSLYFSRISGGISPIAWTEPSWYLIFSSMSALHSPSFLRSSTKNSLTTMKSPAMLDLT
jgi:hypothetical protein